MNRMSLSLAAGLASIACITACGSSDSTATKTAPGAPTTGKPDPAKSAPVNPAGSGSAGAASTCAAQSNGDPANAMICMADHHVNVKDTPALRTCLASAHDPSGIIGCLKSHAG